MSEGTSTSIQAVTGKLGSVKKKIQKEKDAGRSTSELEEEKRSLEKKVTDYNAAKGTYSRKKKPQPTSAKGLLKENIAESKFEQAKHRNLVQMNQAVVQGMEYRGPGGNAPEPIGQAVGFVE